MSMIEMDEPIDAEYELSTTVAPNSNNTQLALRTSYATALSVPKPRVLTNVERSLMQEARLAGELFYYGWGAGKDRIEGPSIGLTMAAARCWGNCAVETLPVQDAGDAWIFTSAFVDLETGFTLSRQFRQSKKSAVHGKHDAERKDDIRFQIGQSKASRNVVKNSIPDWLVNRAIEEAKAGVRAKLEKYIQSNGIEAARDLLARELAKFGVKPEDIANKFDIAALSGLSLENMVILRGDLAALQNGQERAGALFPSMVEPKPGGKVKTGNLDSILGDKPKTPPEATSEPVEAVAAAEPVVQPDSPRDALDPLEIYRQKIRSEFGMIQGAARLRSRYDQLCGPEGNATADESAVITSEYELRRDAMAAKK